MKNALFIHLLLLPLSHLFSQSIVSSQIRPNDGDSIFVDYYGADQKVDSSFIRIFPLTNDSAWNLSSLDFMKTLGGSVNPMSLVYHFNYLEESSAFIPFSNLRVCKQKIFTNRRTPYQVEYWNITDSIWYQRAEMNLMNTSCEVDTGVSGYRYFDSAERYRFPLQLGSKWEDSSSSKWFLYVNSGFNYTADETSEGTIEVVKKGTLITPTDTIFDCWLLHEKKEEFFNGYRSVLNRWVWIKPFVKWPLVDYKEWLDFEPQGPSLITQVQVQKGFDPATLDAPSINAKPAYSIFPNPSNGIINISNSESLKVQVFDINGALIMQANTENAQLDLSDLKNGVYILKMDSPKGESVFEKLIIQH